MGHPISDKKSSAQVNNVPNHELALSALPIGMKWPERQRSVIKLYGAKKNTLGGVKEQHALAESG